MDSTGASRSLGATGKRDVYDPCRRGCGARYLTARWKPNGGSVGGLVELRFAYGVLGGGIAGLVTEVAAAPRERRREPDAQEVAIAAWAAATRAIGTR